MVMDNIEKELYQAAIELVNMRYPSGWGGAAAVRTESGKILTSIAPDTKNDALSLCLWQTEGVVRRPGPDAGGSHFGSGRRLASRAAADCRQCTWGCDVEQ